MTFKFIRDCHIDPTKVGYYAVPTKYFPNYFAMFFHFVLQSVFLMLPALFLPENNLQIKSPNVSIGAEITRHSALYAGRVYGDRLS